MSQTVPTIEPADRVLVVRRSPARVLGILGICVTGLAMTGTLALRLVPGVESGSFIEFLMWGATLFLAWMVLLWGRLLLDTRPVIEIGPAGVFDRRLAAGPIPWRDIAAMRFIQVNSQSMVALDLTPGSRERLVQSWFQRLFTQVNERAGYGITLTVTGLDHDLDTVVEALHGTWVANRGG